MKSRSARALDALWRKRPHLCHWCDCKITRWKTGAEFTDTMATTDHLLPRERSGTSEQYNLVLSCKRCNEHRAHAGHCMAALDCAYDVLGAGASSSSVGRWFKTSARYRSTAPTTLADIWPQRVAA